MENTTAIETQKNTIRIASINLNGETWNLNNKTPRLPVSIFDKQSIKDKLTRILIKGLESILQTQKYDIIAIQELVYSSKERNQIENVVRNCGYTLRLPSLSGSTHFTAGFILKGEYDAAERLEIENFKHNKYCKLACNIDGNAFQIINLHITEDYNKVKNLIQENKDERVIVVGDMNAYSAEQIEGNEEGSVHSDFLDVFTECEYLHDKNANKNYTYLVSNKWRKLDHIFLSKELANQIDSYSETKEDDVNFCANTTSGFTDHSMLVLAFRFKTKSSK